MTDSDASREHVATDGGTTARTNPTESGKGISLAVAGLGLWLLASVGLFGLSGSALWNDVVVGLALLALGGYNYYRRSHERFGSTSAGVLAALLGLWLAVAPLVFAPTSGIEASMPVVWNQVVVGALALVLGVYSANEARRSGVSRSANRS